MTLRLGVLVSGGGTNLQAILDAVAERRLDAEVRLVLSNKPDVFALERAARAGVPTKVLSHKAFASREAFDEAMLAELRAVGVECIALAGFMRVLSAGFIRAYEGRIVNIHPALLPAFPGVDAQRQAFEYGVKIAGCTVHYVDEGVDMGPVIVQRAVPVLDADDAESLRARILVQEHEAYVEALVAISEGRVSLAKSASGRTIVRVAKQSDEGRARGGK
jgi:phosphoribosylglycinamide formyltransferase-1